MNPETNRFEPLDTPELFAAANAKGWKIFSNGEKVSLKGLDFSVVDIQPTKLVLRPWGDTNLATDKHQAVLSDRLNQLLKKQGDEANAADANMAPSSGLAPHQQRVVDEKDALDDKIRKFTGFIGGTIFAGLADAERSRLSIQLQHMNGYSEILSQRIAAF